MAPSENLELLSGSKLNRRPISDLFAGEPELVFDSDALRACFIKVRENVMEEAIQENATPVICVCSCLRLGFNFPTKKGVLHWDAGWKKKNMSDWEWHCGRKGHHGLGYLSGVVVRDAMIMGISSPKPSANEVAPSFFIGWPMKVERLADLLACAVDGWHNFQFDLAEECYAETPSGKYVPIPFLTNPAWDRAAWADYYGYFEVASDRALILKRELGVMHGRLHALIGAEKTLDGVEAMEQLAASLNMFSITAKKAFNKVDLSAMSPDNTYSTSSSADSNSYPEEGTAIEQPSDSPFVVLPKAFVSLARTLEKLNLSPVEAVEILLRYQSYLAVAALEKRPPTQEKEEARKLEWDSVEI